MDNQLTLFPEIPRTFKIKEIIKRNGRVAAFDPDKITSAIYKAALSVGGKDRELAEHLTSKVLGMMNQIYHAGATPTVEEVQDIVEEMLIRDGHARTAKAYILYRAERTRIREKKESPIIAEDNIPYKLLWKAYSWNVDHKCDSVAGLNRWMKDGSCKKLIMDAETHYHKEIRKAADLILKSRDRIKIMIIAGPSSSGKTTTTIKIGEALKKHGISFVTMSLDHYFKNLEMHPKDEYGDYDFESPYALELEMINEHLDSLVKGKTIQMPRYDFKTGKRSSQTTELKLGKDEIILIDTLHGLFGKMTEKIPRRNKFKFYIEAICQIKDENGEFVRWTDLRMLRRMIRDSLHRNYDPLQTVGHWHYVRRGEKKYIVPFIKTADYVFNGSFPYELPVYKNALEHQFPAIIKAFENDPNKADAHLRAQRVYQLLQSLEKFQNLDDIPKDSLIREFIGGSSYKY